MHVLCNAVPVEMQPPPHVEVWLTASVWCDSESRDCYDTLQRYLCLIAKSVQVGKLMLSLVPFSIIFGRSQVACTINQSPELLQRPSFTEGRKWQGVTKQAFTCKYFPWMSFKTLKKTPKQQPQKTTLDF